MTTNDIDAIRQTPLATEPGNNAFVVWYDPYNEPYAVYFRSDANGWDDQRWFNADQHHSGGTEPSAWGALRDELFGNDGPHLLVPGIEVEQLRAELADVRAKYQDALWTASQHGAKVTELTAELAEARAARDEANRKRTVAEAVCEALARDNTGYAAQVKQMRAVVDAARRWAESEGITEEDLAAAVAALPKAEVAS